jgi:hypothetical protein
MWDFVREFSYEEEEDPYWDLREWLYD